MPVPKSLPGWEAAAKIQAGTEPCFPLFLIFQVFCTTTRDPSSLHQWKLIWGFPILGIWGNRMGTAAPLTCRGHADVVLR